MTWVVRYVLHPARGSVPGVHASDASQAISNQATGLASKVSEILLSYDA